MPLSDSTLISKNCINNPSHMLLFLKIPCFCFYCWQLSLMSSVGTVAFELCCCKEDIKSVLATVQCILDSSECTRMNIKWLRNQNINLVHITTNKIWTWLTLVYIVLQNCFMRAFLCLSIWCAIFVITSFCIWFPKSIWEPFYAFLYDVWFLL